MSPAVDPAHRIDWQDDLSALAVGALDGRERARVLAHLKGCPGCSAELESLSDAVDALVEVAPEVAPPAGFTERTVAAMGADRPRHRPTVVVRRVVAVAAGVVILGLGVGVGVAVTSSHGTRPTPAAVTGTLRSSSGPDGVVVVSADRGGLLVMSLDHAPTTGTVTCEVTLTDGTTRLVGAFPLAAGYGSWRVHLPVPPSSVRSVRVLDQQGVTVASATLRA
jgi:hypothetical protein